MDTVPEGVDWWDLDIYSDILAWGEESLDENGNLNYTAHLWYNEPERKAYYQLIFF